MGEKNRLRNLVDPAPGNFLLFVNVAAKLGHLGCDGFRGDVAGSTYSDSGPARFHAGCVEPVAGIAGEFKRNVFIVAEVNGLLYPPLDI